MRRVHLSPRFVVENVSHIGLALLGALRLILGLPDNALTLLSLFNSLQPKRCDGEHFSSIFRRGRQLSNCKYISCLAAILVYITHSPTLLQGYPHRGLKAERLEMVPEI